jgi:hypothetical protein
MVEELLLPRLGAVQKVNSSRTICNFLKEPVKRESTLFGHFFHACEMHPSTIRCHSRSQSSQHLLYSTHGFGESISSMQNGTVADLLIQTFPDMALGAANAFFKVLIA